jgi:hypothetical protein
VIAIECPGCRKQVEVAQTPARCPACNRALRPSALKGRRPASPPPKKGLLRSATFRYAVAIVALIAVACVLFKRQEAGADALWGKVRDRITAETSNLEGRGVLLAVAQAHHLAAVDAATPRDLRGRRSFEIPDEEEYAAILLRRSAGELQGMEAGAPPQAAVLEGYWERLNCENGTRYLVHLRRDGTYRDAHSTLRSPDYSLATPGSGTWNFQKGVLTWRSKGGQDDPNPIVRWGFGGFVLREMDGRYTYFRKISPPSKVASLLN